MNLQGRRCIYPYTRLYAIAAAGLPGEISQHRRLYSSCLAGAISEADYLDGLRRAGLTDVEVKDRLVYDAVQIEAFIGSELAEANSGCCGGGPTTDLAKTWAPKLEGKIASVKVAARKPKS